MNTDVLPAYTHISTRSIDYLEVVIHIIYRTDLDSISDAQILSQIDVLNEDFSMTNANFGDTPDVFKAVAVNTEIRFCLASVDPNGHETSGITRTKTSIDDIGATDFYYSSDSGGKDAWDQDRYINIWVCDMGNSGVAGIGTAPGTASPPAKDGVLVNFRYFGRKGVAELSFPHNEGRICVHEMGHYFGLPHTFGSLGGACSDDDGFADTPLQDQPSFACPTFPNPDMCTQNNGVMFMNFMDYTDDECMTMFTQEQKNRMKQVLDGPRSSLVGNSSAGCIVSVSPASPTASWTLGPNPTSDYCILYDEEHSIPEVLSLYNITGQLTFWTEVLSSEFTLDLSELPQGLYYVKYKNKVKKLVIR